MDIAHYDRRWFRGQLQKTAGPVLGILGAIGLREQDVVGLVKGYQRLLGLEQHDWATEDRPQVLQVLYPARRNTVHALTLRNSAK